MSDAASYIRDYAARSNRSAWMLGQGFTTALMAFDLLLIVVTSMFSGIAYHLYVYGKPGLLENYASLGALIAIFYLLPRSIRGQYDVSEMAGGEPGFRHSFMAWNFAFLCVLVIAFLTKQTGSYSRGAIIIFYMSGLAGLCLARAATISLLTGGMSRGLLAIRRVHLVGTDAKISEFLEKYGARRYGLQIADVTVLPDNPGGSAKRPVMDKTCRERLEETVAHSRAGTIDDIVLLLPWSDTGMVEACTEVLMSIPASIHLGPETVFERFSDVRLIRVGRTMGLNLVRPPLRTAELVSKRALDLFAATLGLIALAPFLTFVALLIKLDSPGPVLFLQRRHGFNHKPFRIFKFRTMTTMDDGSEVRQATRNDRRTTRVGRFLRRWSIDELPQLLNVIKGDMSIVGPRPHAMVHNDEFECRIARYARRHNVKPGITGWAQINGHRGETDTDSKMRARVEHDLYYIDNWSIWFDIYIMAMTALSPRAFTNAH